MMSPLIKKCLIQGEPGTSGFPGNPGESGRPGQPGYRGDKGQPAHAAVHTKGIKVSKYVLGNAYRRIDGFLLYTLFQ